MTVEAELADIGIKGTHNLQNKLKPTETLINKTMNRYINVGDIVAVNFYGAQTTLSHRAKLLSYPTATGDSWVIRDIDTGQIHYISEGCTISLIEKS